MIWLLIAYTTLQIAIDVLNKHNNTALAYRHRNILLIQAQVQLERGFYVIIPVIHRQRHFISPSC